MKDQPTIQKKYTKTQKISQGSYGVVYKGKVITTGQIVAIKKFKSLTNQGIPVSCIRQLHILNLLQTTHPIQSPQLTLKLYDVYQQKNEIQMVVEWMDQTLADIIKGEQPYETKKLFSDILNSVLQLHQHFIIHRDIKPANIMYSHANGVMKVLDYGMAKEIQFEDRPMTNQVGSLYYRAPELLLGAQRYDFSVDIWALGCVFYEMLTKKVLFKGENQLDQLKKVFEITGTPKQQNNNEALNELMKKVKIDPIQENWSKLEAEVQGQVLSLLKIMLNLDPKLRPTVSEILSHKYFSLNK